MNRINIICLGTKNMEEALEFYRDKLGFMTDEAGKEPAHVLFYNDGSRLSLYSLEGLLQDMQKEYLLPSHNTFRGFTLAYSCKTKDEVYTIVEKARVAGANIIKEPQDVFWGGFHAYFADLDGYVWEVAYYDQYKFDEQNMLTK